MTVIQSLPYALFCMAVVFAVLIILSVIIKLLSLAVRTFAPNETEISISQQDCAPVDETVNEPEMSCGELKLYNVDEPTAAMIMAIVSDESGIPLEELCFKSIIAKD